MSTITESLGLVLVKYPLRIAVWILDICVVLNVAPWLVVVCMHTAAENVNFLLT